jgi:hypothetical protein
MIEFKGHTTRTIFFLFLQELNRAIRALCGKTPTTSFPFEQILQTLNL